MQKFGTFLSGMIMPNIAAFIAWGLITAFFIETGWTPVAELGGFGTDENGEENTGLVGPMITYLLPLLIAIQGGRMVHGLRGGVVAAVATMGVIVGTDQPMFLGALVMGPLAGWVMKQLDRLWEGRVKPGFEMLVDNFSAGIVGAALAVLGFFSFAPVVSGISTVLGNGVDWLVDNGVLPLASIIIEPAKVLFLNNAINHGVLTPLGVSQSVEDGRSILFLLEANPGPGLGVLLAWMVFGTGMARSTAPAAAVIHFFGGIHEIYFPYVLMKPVLLLGAISGGMVGIATLTLFDAGLRAPAAPGSIIAVLAQTPSNAFLGVVLSVLLSAATSFLVCSVLLKASRKKDGDLAGATAAMEGMKGKKSSVADVLAGPAGERVGSAAAGGEAIEDAARTDRAPIQRIVFACDAGMGSSAMGASVLRNKIKKAGFPDVSVSNQAIANLTDDADLIVTHRDLTARARTMAPSAEHVSVDNFLNSPQYDAIVEEVRTTNRHDATSSN
ncbi:PTS system D-mannitol-specific IIA component, Fru family /PTS system D-mannitol-specific IIB component, Fru family /PTS system D-mannitol-specific IIC component, Fru family [Geodermatophilus pulveris]|uniref:PTS system mannitol-specific EIICB component n=1 Tax=Geodermatophilus pulveris TaxID=1564159 RepID=A0A239H044_9ACTN|nr:PTS system D-mannitol-specific IIA component, Fru family /PTS system D-mannitol-specific IIB component, Fru family /PTS system D-mannitol-specific IIC component, Fru family [Geodermatophilus pulveris]